MNVKFFALVLGGILSFGLNIRVDAKPPDTSVVTGNTGFAADLYGKLQTQKGNLFFSPYSISTALAMTYGGARGETAHQMARTLHFDLPEGKLAPAFVDLASGLDAVQAEGHVRLAVANSLWPQAGYKFRRDYLDLCGKSGRWIIWEIQRARGKRSMDGWRQRPTAKSLIC